MPGDTGKHLADDKAVPHHGTGDHKALIHSLSPGDWQAHFHDSKNTSSYLPKTDIVHLTDHKKSHSERLSAAHKLVLGHKTDIVDHDDTGRPLHLQITEGHTGKATHIVVKEIEGGKTHTYLEGDLTSDNGAHSDAPAPSESPSPQHHRQHHHSHGHHHLRHQSTRGDDDSPQAPSPSNMASPADFSLSQQGSQSESRPASISPQSDFAPPNAYSSTAEFKSPADINGRFSQAQAFTGAASDKMIQLPDGTVYMRTHLRVDADGGPEWSSDAYGQAETSLRDSNGRPLNAKAVNYFVLPLGNKWKHMGIKLGDIAWVRNTANGKIVPAIFGDQGPANKLGEGSQGLCRALGLSDNPNHGGTDNKNIEFLIVPHSGTGTGDIARSTDQMAARLIAKDTRPTTDSVA